MIYENLEDQSFWEPVSALLELDALRRRSRSTCMQSAAGKWTKNSPRLDYFYLCISCDGVPALVFLEDKMARSTSSELTCAWSDGVRERGQAIAISIVRIPDFHFCIYKVA
jgi:hypothetical protein